MDRPLIVQTVVATTMAELCAAASAVEGVDIVELRVDGVHDLDVPAALAGRRLPTIVTCRPTWEGGRFVGDEAVRRQILTAAVAAGADFVDVEWQAGWLPDVAGTRTRVVVSNHDFAGVPHDLTQRLAAMRATGAAVVKVACQAATLPDVLRLRQEVLAAGNPGATAAIAMGQVGQVSRMLPDRFGSCWTYAGEAAPGQLSAAILRERFRVGSVSSATAVYAVAGTPIAHSASPAMHNAAFREAGLDAVYVPLNARTPDEVEQAATALGLVGISLTAPVKSGWADRAGVTIESESAAALRVCNTLKRVGGGWAARNVDVDGFLDALDAHGVVVSGAVALVVGAGGAARAAGWALQRRGARVAVAARRNGEASAMAAELRAEIVSWPPHGIWDLLVNATPVGTWPGVDDTPVPDLTACRAAVVYDLVYNPAETRLLRDAAALGARVIGGLDMLVGQAARQFEWWTGRRPSPAVMRAAARAFVEETRTV